MFSPMVTINDPIYSEEMPAGPSHAKLVRSRGNSSSFTAAFLASATAPQLPTPASSVVSSFVSQERQEEPTELKLSDFLDIPSLVTDDEEEESDAESSAHGLKSLGDFDEVVPSKPASAATQEVKRFIKKEVTQEEAPQLPDEVVEKLPSNDVPTVEQKTLEQSSEKQTLLLAPGQFNTERLRVMKIIVKYISMKISNSFPPESPRTMDPNEMPLESFLMILVSRLQLTLPMFMKGIIYLFRYMDIIYLLRYLNQSNNFANYTEMGFCIKKLIIGCFKLTLTRERIQRDWSGITGLANSEINTIVKAVVNRLNGKLSIKNVELIRLKTEIFRFVKMVTKTV